MVKHCPIIVGAVLVDKTPIDLPEDVPSLKYVPGRPEGCSNNIEMYIVHVAVVCTLRLTK